MGSRATEILLWGNGTEILYHNESSLSPFPLQYFLSEGKLLPGLEAVRDAPVHPHKLKLLQFQGVIQRMNIVEGGLILH